MRITVLQPPPHAPCSLSESILQVGGIAIDLEGEQRSSQTIIDVSKSGVGLKRGLGDGYVASVLIPPAEYEELEGDDREILLVRRPLNTDTVELMLWRYEEADESEEE